VSRTLYSAARIKPDNTEACIQLMDELDETGAQLAAFEATDPDRNRSWKCRQWVRLYHLAEGSRFGCHFLSLAVRYAVTEYVAAKATPGCITERPNVKLDDGGYIDASDSSKPVMYPLLLDALEYDHNRVDSLESVPNYNMVACLLRKGATFQPIYDKLNPWYVLLWNNLMDRYGGDTSEIDTWIDIAELAQREGHQCPRRDRVVFSTFTKQRLMFPDTSRSGRPGWELDEKKWNRIEKLFPAPSKLDRLLTWRLRHGFSH
jgi:hypothetical protein